MTTAFSIYDRRNAARRAVAVVACVCAVTIALGAVAQIPPPTDPLSFDAPDPAARFRSISIEQHLEAQVALDLQFVDETGAKVRLGDYVGDRPAILALVYYECPMLCNLMLDGVETAIQAVKYDIGTDYDVITVSIDPGETPELAAQKKANHLERLGVEGAEAGWHFLTGTEEAIEILADTVGYQYTYDPATDQYAHAAGIMVLTPTGKVARYFYGIEYIARDVEFGLAEASEGRVGSLVDQIVLLCYAYDPSKGTYGFIVIRAMQIGAVLMVLGFAVMYLLLYLSWRKKNKGAGGGPSELSDAARPTIG